MTSARFDEGSTFLVEQLHFLDPGGQVTITRQAAVVFTPGWIYIQEADSDGYVLPRERVLIVRGLKRPRTSETP